MFRYFISWLCSFIYPLNGVYLELCTSISKHSEEWDFDGYYLKHKSGHKIHEILNRDID